MRLLRSACSLPGVPAWRSPGADRTARPRRFLDLNAPPPAEVPISSSRSSTAIAPDRFLIIAAWAILLHVPGLPNMLLRCTAFQPASLLLAKPALPAAFRLPAPHADSSYNRERIVQAYRGPQPARAANPPCPSGVPLCA